ncbi:MAG TPA: hypothetical protein VJO35_07475 [Terriglobales bacterium]|nr:hypothetical protein [Terriglobales bacterium]
MTSSGLASALEEFLVGSSNAIVIEDGAVTFDFAQTKYSVSGENNKCLLHLWSPERNVVRRVLELETRGETLRITVQKIGQARPSKLEICREPDPRTAQVKRAARLAYRRVLERALRKHFADFAIFQLSTSMDLEKSFGPIYTRGLIKRGQSAFAVLGVNRGELQSSIDAALTFGILWLDACRQLHAGKLVVEGLKLFVPHGCSEVVRARIAHLNSALAKWQLYELEERSEELKRIEFADRGNISTRLVHCVDETEAFTRFEAPIALVRTLMPEVEVAIISPAEVSFRCYGLEFARARLAARPGHLLGEPEIVFGVGPAERTLEGQNFPQFERLVRSIGEVRHPDGPSDNKWWRLHPERWLESLVTKNICALDDQFDPRWRYSQVPAFSGSDRGMIDVLTLTRAGRLAVIELKADEDVHLPLQGIDYWSRVVWHHARGEFQKFGYFDGYALSSQAPLLVMAAPALHVHPATDALLRYISPEIEWSLLGIDERWRKQVRVVFRKRGIRSLLKTAV